MLIFLIRHAAAEERGGERPDEDRELTEDGRRRARRAFKGLRALEPRIDHLLSSPLARAWQTARLVARVVGTPAPRVETSLAPGASPEDVVARLARFPEDARVALVGHEPELGALAGFLLGGRALALRKSGVAALEVTGAPAAGRASLEWLAPPAVLACIR